MSVRIAEGLGEEFEGQAAQERELGHPVSVMLAPTVLRKAELEIGFITFVVMPLYVLLTKVAPDLVTFVDRVVRRKREFHHFMFLPPLRRPVHCAAEARAIACAGCRCDT